MQSFLAELLENNGTQDAEILAACLAMSETVARLIIILIRLEMSRLHDATMTNIARMCGDLSSKSPHADEKLSATESIRSSVNDSIRERVESEHKTNERAALSRTMNSRGSSFRYRGNRRYAFGRRYSPYTPAWKTRGVSNSSSFRRGFPQRARGNPFAKRNRQ